jgi:integrase
MVIRRSLSWARPQGEEVRPRYFPPKTKACRRTISIPALLVAELKRWKIQCPIAEDGLVFLTNEGKPMPRAKMSQIQFYPALCRAKLRRVTFHLTRGTPAMIWLQSIRRRYAASAAAEAINVKTAMGSISETTSDAPAPFRTTPRVARTKWVRGSASPMALAHPGIP